MWQSGLATHWQHRACRAAQRGTRQRACTETSELADRRASSAGTAAAASSSPRTSGNSARQLSRYRTPAPPQPSK